MAPVSEFAYRTEPGRAWSAAARELERVLTVLADDFGPEHSRFLVEAAVLAASSRFQTACTGLFALAARAIADRVGGDLGAVVLAGITADSRLARGNATSAALARDFARVGVDIWDLPFPDGSDGMSARFELDDANALRNDVAHGRVPGTGDDGLVVADALDVIATCSRVLAVIESGTLQRFDRFDEVRGAE